MIGNLKKGRSLRGLLDYLLDQRDQKGELRPRVKIIASSFAGTTARQIAREFAALRALRPALSVAVVHEMLRLPPTAQEPTDEQWSDIAKYWCEEMGFQAWVAVAHGDGHIHIAACRIRIDGSVVSDSQDWTHSERIVREIEERFGLDAVEPSHLLAGDRDWVKQKAPSQAQIIMGNKLGAALPTDILATIIDRAVERKGSVTELVEALENAGIDVRANIATTGKVSGLAYRVGTILVTAKALGRSYSWANLIKRGLSFDNDRDLPALLDARALSLAREVCELPVVGGTAVATAQTFAQSQIAAFVHAAEDVDFLVGVEVDGAVRPIDWEVGTLGDEATTRGLLDDNRAGGGIVAIPRDRRIVVLDNLSSGGVRSLSELGYEPFSVAEIEPNSFQACIRLASRDVEAPSHKVQRLSAILLANLVGGAAPHFLRLPGFFNWAGKAKQSRRNPLVVLTHAAATVARAGMDLLREVIRTLSDGPERAGSSAKVPAVPSVTIVDDAALAPVLAVDKKFSAGDANDSSENACDVDDPLELNAVDPF